ncbi:hypothetical protein [Clostridium sp. DJ247]|uniref:hypothetical protein n=1 Tax=Clostridium sp. DJ247 TaxID=2726188 RepID=UPI0016276A2B|nr:hypothetical protein [Clostridium sp. DJ247]MBC2580865.1 hypothetical protein [Clostridium sp. DJ247]
MIYIKKYNEYSIKNLEFIGKGIHGKVYRIDSSRCIKIFKKSSFCEKELKTLEMAQGNNHFPKIYDFGKNYIVRDYIHGIELDKYLAENPLTLELSQKIIELYKALAEVGFKRRDTVLFHIFVTGTTELKLIDTARVMKENTIYPKLLLKGLDELGYKKEFLDHVKLLNPHIYECWKEVHKI